MDIFSAIQSSVAAIQQSVQTAIEGPGFAGMDTAYYPGDAVMDDLIKFTNLYWTGLYLTPSPSQGHNLGWMTTYSTLLSQGWGIAPIYVGQQPKGIPKSSHILTPEQGAKDGVHAASLASTAGIAPGCVIYLDFENGPPCINAQKQYFIAWCNAILEKGYRPGVYCLHGIAGDLMVAFPNAWVWAVKYSYPNKHYSSPYPHPAASGCGVGSASMWQLRGNVWIYYKNDHGVTKKAWADLNTSDFSDPSNPFG